MGEERLQIQIFALCTWTCFIYSGSFICNMVIFIKGV